MSINQSIENFLNTANLPDNCRNWARGFELVVNLFNSQKVTKVALKEIYNGANRNPDSGRLLNPELANLDKVMLQDFINSNSDTNLKSSMTTLLGEFETWLNS